MARMAEIYGEHLSAVSTHGDTYAVQQKPVIILPKINHSDFSRGFFVRGDVESELEPRQATEIIAKTTSEFLKIHSVDDEVQIAESTGYLKGQGAKTASLVEPFLSARELEKNGSWCIEAQKEIAGAENLAQLEIKLLHTDSLKGFMQGHTNIHEISPGQLELTIISHTKASNDIMRLGKTIAAQELSCKMVSRQKIEQALGKQESGERITCKDINSSTFNYALSKVAPQTLQRYYQRGKLLSFLDDKRTFAGPQFVFASNVTYEENDLALQISSPTLYTKMNSIFYPGNHYCKIMTPARAIEWISSDSLY